MILTMSDDIERKNQMIKDRNEAVTEAARNIGTLQESIRKEEARNTRAPSGQHAW